ncbi:hypothetical protein [Psychrobacter aquimaris]|uniref:hypothetical protein n=1 Tax=Psychrobacter aquimaris TaxID=292733 RepID=UPI0018DFE65C|nr:hypothetical protein [Psychrobacter aquimaris]
MRSLFFSTLCLASSLSLVACNTHQPNTASKSTEIITNTTKENADKQPNVEPSSTKEPLSAFTAFGNKEKSWRTVVNGNQLSIEADFLKPTTIVVSRSTDAEGVEYVSTVSGKPIIMNIHGQTCTDDNGYQNEFTATLTYDNKSYQGCAVAGAFETAPT